MSAHTGVAFTLTLLRYDARTGRIASSLHTESRDEFITARHALARAVASGEWSRIDAAHEALDTFMRGAVARCGVEA